MIPRVRTSLINCKSLDDYLKYVVSEKDNIVVHALKLFYYTHHKGIHDKSYTIKHWTDELTSYFNIKYLSILNGDALPPKVVDELSLNLLNIDINKGINSLKSHMVSRYSKTKGPHQLPYLDDLYIVKKIPKFIKFYNQFIDDILSRVLDNSSVLNLDMLTNYVIYCTKVNNDLKLLHAATKYNNFSYLKSNLSHFIVKNFSLSDLKMLVKYYKNL